MDTNEKNYVWHVGDSCACHPQKYLTTLLLFVNELYAVRRVHMSVFHFYFVHPISFSICRGLFSTKILYVFHFTFLASCTASLIMLSEL